MKLEFKLIESNLKNGKKETELYIDKEIAGEVRSLISDKIKELGKENDFDWATVRTGSNPHTGRTEYFTGMVVGDKRYYKLRYCGK
jgi:hypothetical protein